MNNKSDVLANFSTKLEKQGLSDNTRRAYNTDIKEFLDWTGPLTGQMASMHFLAEKTPDYLNELRKTGVSNSTVNRRAVALRKFFKGEGIVALPDYRTPPRVEGKAHPLPNLMDDLRKMLAVTKGQTKVAIALMGFAGLRIAEARVLTWDDISDNEITVHGKGNKVRRVPIAPELRVILDAHDHTYDHLIRMTDRGIRYAITRAGEKAEISRPVASHDLRMTFGTVVYNVTKDLRVVQELLGHESSSTTERYTGITEAAKVAAVLAMP